MNDLIHSEHYFTAQHGVQGADKEVCDQHFNDVSKEGDNFALPISVILSHNVIATIVLKTGEVLVGTAFGEYNAATQKSAKANALARAFGV